MEEKSISLLELINKIIESILFILKKWKIILVSMIVGSGIGIIYSIRSVPTFKSTLTFIVEGKSASGGLSNLINNIGLGTANSQSVFTPENILELVKSRLLVQKALLRPIHSNQKKSFADLYSEIYGLKATDKKENIKFIPYTDCKKMSLTQNEILENIYNSLASGDLTVEMKNSDNTIITLELTSLNEEFSRYFPEILMSEVAEYYIESKTRKAKLNYSIIKKQTDSVRLELNNAISGVAASNDNNFFLNPAFNIKRAPTGHKEVNVQANTAILSELVKNLELSRMNILNETPIIEIIDKPISPIKEKVFRKSKGIIIGGLIFGILSAGILLLVNLINKQKENYYANK